MSEGALGRGARFLELQPSVRPLLTLLSDDVSSSVLTQLRDAGFEMATYPAYPVR